MKLISLWEPWATLMALERKKIETRSWHTSYRGWLAIHASKGGLGKIAMRTCLADPVFAEALGSTPLNPGKIVAVVHLNTCLPTNMLDTLISPTERYFGDYSPGRYAWVTERCFRLPEPIPFTGKQGLVDVPSDILVKLRRQWKEEHSRCFRCDGHGFICDICGESEVACKCEEPTFSDCSDCGGTGK